MPTEPSLDSPIVAIVQEMNVEAGEITGKVIALQYTDSNMIYLVDDSNSDRAPVWVGEWEITRTY